MEHGIGSGGTGLTVSGPMAELDRAPGAPTSMTTHGLMMGPTTELEDPPGLYEKVQYSFQPTVDSVLHYAVYAIVHVHVKWYCIWPGNLWGGLQV